MSHYYTFREQLAINYPTYGHALWLPDPGRGRGPVDVGDVGIIREGTFLRLFNALLPRDHPSNSDSQRSSSFPPQLQPGTPDHIQHTKGDSCNYFHSKNVIEMPHPHKSGVQGSKPYDSQVTFSCSERRGALLYLPFPAECKDTVARDEFAKWMVSNIDRCMRVAEDLGSGVTHMEDIILVTGCHLTKSWVSVTFSKTNRGDALVSFGVRRSGSSEVDFEEWDVDGGNVMFGPQGKNLLENQCIFVRGYRGVRILNTWPRLRGRLGSPSPRRRHGPLPGSDQRLQLIGIPDDAEVQDPLSILLEYMVEHTHGCDMALVHDDDLGCINGASLETLQPDVLKQFLKSHAPVIHQARCDKGRFPGKKSEPGAETFATVATLSLETQKSLERPAESLGNTPGGRGAQQQSEDRRNISSSMERRGKDVLSSEMEPSYSSQDNDKGSMENTLSTSGGLSEYATGGRPATASGQDSRETETCSAEARITTMTPAPSSNQTTATHGNTVEGDNEFEKRSQGGEQQPPTVDDRQSIAAHYTLSKSSNTSASKEASRTRSVPHSRRSQDSATSSSFRPRRTEESSERVPFPHVDSPCERSSVGPHAQQLDHTTSVQPSAKPSTPSAPPLKSTHATPGMLSDHEQGKTSTEEQRYSTPPPEPAVPQAEPASLPQRESGSHSLGRSESGIPANERVEREAMGSAALLTSEKERKRTIGGDEREIHREDSAHPTPPQTVEPTSSSSHAAPPLPALQIQSLAPSTEPSPHSCYVTAQNTPLTTRSPMVGQSPKTQVPPSPGTPPVLLPEPVATPPSPSPAALPMLPPQQQSTAVSPQTERVIPVPQTPCSPSELSKEPERGGAFSEAGPSPLGVLFPQVPSLSTVAIMSRGVRGIPRPYSNAIGGRIDGQLLEAYPEHADATPDEDVSGSQVQRRKRKRNWFQKHIFDYKKSIGFRP